MWACVLLVDGVIEKSQLVGFGLRVEDHLELFLVKGWTSECQQTLQFLILIHKCIEIVFGVGYSEHCFKQRHFLGQNINHLGWLTGEPEFVDHVVLSQWEVRRQFVVDTLQNQGVCEVLAQILVKRLLTRFVKDREVIGKERRE